MAIQTEIEQHYKEMARFTEAILQQYRPALLAVEAQLFDEVAKMLTALKYDADGNLLPDQDLQKIIAEIDLLYLKVSNNPAFKESTTQFLTNFDTIRQNQIALHQAVNKAELTANLTANLTKQQTFLIQATEYGLRQGGLKLYFVEQAKQVLIQSATFGYSIQESEKLLRKRIKTTYNNDSYFLRYATQVARDSISEYQGQINQMYAKEFDFKYIRYIGSLVKDSRPLCKHLIHTYGTKPIPVTELNKTLKKYGGSKSLSKGMKPNTSIENFCIVRGGYNCMHEAIPTRE